MTNKNIQKTQKPIKKKKNKTIIIEIEGGVLTDVRNLPPNWDYKLIDKDI